MAASQVPDRSFAGSYYDLVVEIQQRHRDLEAVHAAAVADRDRLQQIVEGLLGVYGKYVDVEEVARWRSMAGLGATKEQRDDHCPHCRAGEPSVWDDVLFHYAHPDGVKLKLCHEPWRERCRRCSAGIPAQGVPCSRATCDPNYRCTCLRHDQGFGTERHTRACARRYAETRRQIAEDSP